ncbi:putative acyl-CoA thioester hydrolase [Ralstonia sp. 25C]|uniref:putative acyl-CoA thioester hydrolase n=1 Tax=Ralstonia sp. 25C TaxID=3447363 RepID=UPI003F750AC0
MKLQVFCKKIVAFSVGCTIASSAAMAVTSTATRPQLSSTDAQTYTIAKYMAQFGTVGSLTTDNWDPTAGVGATSTFTANYTVASDGTAQYKTVQDAIDAAVNAGGVTRKYISVKAGTYNELVCVKASAPPITLYGLDTTSGNTVIVFNNANPTPTSGATTNPCMGTSTSSTIGTLRSSTAMVLAANFQAANLTFKNSYVEGTFTSSNQSAVALALRGDKAVLQNVSIIGNQDTLYIGASSNTNVVRAYFKGSFIQGDTDFIFGSGTAVFDGCTVQYTASRLGAGKAGIIFAPSTVPGNTYGFLAINSTFNSAGGASDNTIYLGRAWDEGVTDTSSYVNGTSPNGQVVVRDSTLGAHIFLTAPWGTSTAGRPYCSANCTNSANRFFEYNNTGAGSGN